MRLPCLEFPSICFSGYLKGNVNVRRADNPGTAGNMINNRHVIVIGAGVGGLASAALLAKDGYEVTVLEKNEQPGGRASLLEKDGFRFDMGPSWYLMPDVYERFFQAMGTTTR